MSLQVLRITGWLSIFHHGVEIPFFLDAWWIHSRKGWLCFLLYYNNNRETLDTISFHVILGYFHNCVIFLPGGTQVTGVKIAFCTESLWKETNVLEVLGKKWKLLRIIDKMYIHKNSLTRHLGQEQSVIEQSRQCEFSDGGNILALPFQLSRYCKGAK